MSIKDRIHPVFFWAWSTLLATAVVRLDESILSLSVVLGVLLFFYLLPKQGFRYSVFKLTTQLALLAVAIRMSFAVAIGVPMPGNVIFSVPQIDLPDYLVGIRLGGDVTTQRISGAFNEAILFAALILLFGAANSLVAPTRILKVIPRPLYGVGIATTLATTLVPQFANSVTRIRQAQFLRGQGAQGFRNWRRIGTPVLEDALARSLDLSAALEARGYGLHRRTTRYKPVKWELKNSIALLPAGYCAIVLPVIEFSQSITALVLLAATMTPLVLLPKVHGALR